MPEADVLDLMTSLVEKSLVIYEEQYETGRYRLLETVRQYARDRLLEAGEAEATRGRHRDWLLGLAERAEPELCGPRQMEWLARLDLEVENLRAALTWGIGSDPEIALRLATATWRFWDIRGHFRELRGVIEGALERGPDASEKVRAKALAYLGYVAYRQGEWEPAIAFLEQAIVLSRAIGDGESLGLSLNFRGQIARIQGEYDTAQAQLEEALAIRREIGDRWGMSVSLNDLGTLAENRGDLETARASYEQSLALKREIGDRRGIAYSYRFLGDLAVARDDTAAAREYHREALAIFRELGDRFQVAFSGNRLGRVMQAEGDDEEARRLHEEALAYWRESGRRAGLGLSLRSLGQIATARREYDRARGYLAESLALSREREDGPAIAAVLEGLAIVFAGEGDAVRAARLFGAAEVVREALGVPESSSARERAEYEGAVTSTRDALGEARFAAAWTEGRAMSLEQAATACALEAV